MPTYNLPLSDLQTALYTRLSGILSVGVGDFIEENTAFPYASIGDFSVTANGTKNTGDVIVIGTIHVWSKYEGMKECQQIADTICASLTGDDLDLTTYRVYHTELESFDSTTEFNGSQLIRHGTLRIRWFVT